MSDARNNPNALINESSPYLLQHAYNPVKWFPWGKEAFDKAVAENKPVIISIGYSACHWCHVMEKESFEDDGTAAIMNEHFICIKVDREERPDVDAIYMDAVQLMSGRGGWPLNCITLPDQKPLYGGTYFSRSQWQQVLLKVAGLYKSDPDQCRKYAEELTAGVSQMERIVKEKSEPDFNFKDIYRVFESQFDTIDGGMNRSPKFPMPSNWEFLLQYNYHFNDVGCLKQTELTLFKMATGGIFDQLGGGFARYSTDEKWKVPHFEKMLYDNAQLLSLYSHAFQLTGDLLYKKTVYDTANFITRELTSPVNGFYSALDADSEGMEGKFYIWTQKEFDILLTDKLKRDVFFEYFKINERELWEENYFILQWISNVNQVAEKFNLTTEQIDLIIENCKSSLWQERKKRIAPGLDDKQLCSWNALMLKGFIDAYLAFGDDKFLTLANNNASFIIKYLLKGSELYRTVKNSNATIHGFLDDYSFTIDAFISLYQCTSEKGYLQHAIMLNEKTIELFSDKETGMFYFTSNTGEQLIARKMEVQDNVINSSNSVMCKNLFLLGKLTGNYEWQEQAQQMVANMSAQINQSAPWYANWAQSALLMQENNYEIVICGNDARNLYKELASSYLPNCMIVYSSEPDENNMLFKGRYEENKTGIYICINNSCRLPVYSVNDALNIISNN
jgi:uncharacterized protein